MTTPSFTLGFEEEYQTFDPDSYDLRSHIQMEILEKCKAAVDTICAVFREGTMSWAEHPPK